MNGIHRPDGIWIAADASSVRTPAALADAAPALLAALGIPFDGEAGGDPGGPRREISAAEEEAVRARLRALGYLESS
jgi:hypothetical protein